MSTTQAKSSPGLAGFGNSGFAYRWMLLLIFPIGYAISSGIFFDPIFLLENVVGFFALALVLSGMSGNPVTDMPVWIILVTFILGYYVKFFAMAWIIGSGGPWIFDGSFEGLARDVPNALEAFRMITFGFISFALVTSILQRPGLPTDSPASPAQTPSDESVRTRRLILTASIALIGFMAVTAALQAGLGIGVMGSENVVLPYHLSGIIFHPREKTIPVLLVCLAWLADRTRERRTLILVIALLVLHAVTQSLIQASRGQLFYAFIPLAFLWILESRFTRQRVLAMLAVVVLAMALHPLITGLRLLRLFGEDLSVATILSARDAASANATIGANLLLSGVVDVVNRMSGTDTLLFATAWHYPSFLSVQSAHYFLFNPTGLTFTQVMTQDVAGFGPDEFTHSIAPTLIGTGVVLGGVWGVVFLCGLWTIFVHALLRFALKSRIRIRPVAWAVIANWLFLETNAFTVLDNIHWPLFAALGLAIGELLARHLGIPPSLASNVPRAARQHWGSASAAVLAQ